MVTVDELIAAYEGIAAMVRQTGEPSQLEGIPVLPCYDTGKEYRVWCKWCNTWHVHGRTDGHRVAHCAPYCKHMRRGHHGEYYRRGYFIVCVGEWVNRPATGREVDPWRKLLRQ